MWIGPEGGKLTWEGNRGEDTGVSRHARHWRVGRVGYRQHSPPYSSRSMGKYIAVGESEESCLRSPRDRQCGLGVRWHGYAPDIPTEGRER